MNSTCPLVPGTTTAVSRFHLSIRSERPLLADGPSKGRSCWIAVNMAVKIGSGRWAYEPERAATNAVRQTGNESSLHRGSSERFGV